MKYKSKRFRRDKYSKLAKETGYRSRAAFKLIQLNRKFGFLQRSKVLIDLCAAPGGWMQVAQQNMPVSSIVVGVDQYEIKPVPHCLTVKADITTETCRQALKKELRTWKADVVLNDGSPKLGTNWVYDAYQQNILTLNAMKLASEFLVKGGWFVTKIFRSKDYNSILWVAKQLFKKVTSTKPTASREASAEIFLVCFGYLAPDKIDPKFFDIQHVFKDLEVSGSQTKFDLLDLQKRRKAQGYDASDLLVYRKIPISEFIKSEKYVELLSRCSELVFDDTSLRDHKLTSPEILECCKDVQIVGRTELKKLISWRKTIREETHKPTAAEEKPVIKEVQVDELEAVEKELEKLNEEQRRDLKKKKKKLLLQQHKLQEQIHAQKRVHGDTGPNDTDHVFSIREIKSGEDLSLIEEEKEGDIVIEPESKRKRPRSVLVATQRDRDEVRLDKSGTYYHESDSENEAEPEEDVVSDEEGLAFNKKTSKEDKKKKKKKVRFEEPDATEDNPLLMDDPGESMDRTEKKIRKAQQWFSKEAFASLEDDEDEDLELKQMANVVKKLGKPVKGVQEDTLNDADMLEDEESEEEGQEDVGMKSDDQKETELEMESDTSDSEEEEEKKETEKVDGPKDSHGNPLKKELSTEELAIGTKLIHSQKSRRDIIDAGWNRYAFSKEEDAPEWFIEDEKRHMKPPPLVEKELLEEYNERLKDVNARTIKKVAEAKARKRKRSMKKMEKIKKQAEVISNMDLPDREKMHMMRQVYKNAYKKKKKQIQYVVTKKGDRRKGKRMKAGVKGPYKRVDKRMKTDNRKQKEEVKRRKVKSFKKKRR